MQPLSRVLHGQHVSQVGAQLLLTVFELGAPRARRLAYGDDLGLLFGVDASGEPVGDFDHCRVWEFSMARDESIMPPGWLCGARPSRGTAAHPGTREKIAGKGHWPIRVYR